jgi:MFS family permease
VSTVGNNLYYLALPWYIFAVTGSRTDLISSGLAIRLPALARLVVGVLVDRWPKKTLMMAADSVRLVVAVGLAWIAAQRGPFGILLLGVILFELAGTFFSPAESALLPLVVPMEDIAAAEGLQQSSTAVAGLTGRLLGGPLLIVLGAPWLFLSNAASFVCSLISLLGVQVTEPPRPHEPRATFREEWWAGIRAVFESHGLSRLIGSGLLANFGLSALTIILTTWIKAGEHGTAAVFSVVSGAFLTGSIVGGMAFAALARRLPPAVLRTSVLLFGLCVGLIGMMRNPAWTVGCMGGAGLTDALFNSWVGTYLVKQTPMALRGRVFSTFGGLMLATGPLGLTVFGVLLTIGVAMPLLFGIMGVFAVAAGVVTPVYSSRDFPVTVP